MLIPMSPNALCQGTQIAYSINMRILRQNAALALKDNPDEPRIKAIRVHIFLIPNLC